MSAAHCSCGRWLDWPRLPLCGYMLDPGGSLELRNCPACGSTRARELPAPPATLVRCVRDVLAALHRAVVPVVVDVCSCCGRPTHASESDDLDRCEACILASPGLR